MPTVNYQNQDELKSAVDNAGAGVSTATGGTTSNELTDEEKNEQSVSIGAGHVYPGERGEYILDGNADELDSLSNTVSNIFDDQSNLTDTSLVEKVMTDNLSGIEGLPYQFLPSVDRRSVGEVGRKYAEKIFSRLPLLFLVPCKQVFMADASADDKNIITSVLTGADSSALNMLSSSGRYYGVEYDYSTYYRYLNAMLSAVSSFLGIYNTEININGKRQKLGTVAWQNELNDSFKTFFSAQENIVFYLDGLTQVSESFSNNTTESQIASSINGYSDTTNEIRFLFGQKGSLVGTLIDSVTDLTSSISSALSGVTGKLGGGIVGSLAESGVNTILNGGKIIFPEIWQDSQYDRSYSLDIKLRSPDNDSLSIFLNILKPYCRILCLALPRLMESSDGEINPNGYRSPFLVKAYCKGLFNVDMGIISSLSVTKGAECCWNDDGLPTQIDISIDIKDLYSSLAMSGFGTQKNGIFDLGGISSIVNNTAYMDFLANMAGLNICQMEWGRKAKLYYYLSKTSIKQTPARVFTRFDQMISTLAGKLYRSI